MRIKHLGPIGLALCATAGVPATAAAAPALHLNRHHLTINLKPQQITSGDPIVIYGRLFGRHHADQSVQLFNRVAGARDFTPVGAPVRTDTTGAYEITRADGVVVTNRSYYVRSDGVRSRARFERVQALVTLQGPADSNLLTGPEHPYTFSGTVDPAKVGATVLLQRQRSDGVGDDWQTIGQGVVAQGGTFSIVYHFIVPGDASIRVLIRRDVDNVASTSSPLSYQISQAQNSNLTIAANPDPITSGGSVTITGTVAKGANQVVVLYARAARTAFGAVAQATTDANGNYSFTEMPLSNTLYQVRNAQQQGSAIVFEGVRDNLTAMVSATTVQAGQTLTFSGTVSPNRTGHVIYLQRQNATGGDFHTVKVSHVGMGSAYSINKKVYDAGTKQFRVLIPGGPENQGAVSQVFTITVTPATAAQLAPARG